jgi:hypothetical protein
VRELASVVRLDFDLRGALCGIAFRKLGVGDDFDFFHERTNVGILQTIGQECIQSHAAVHERVSDRVLCLFLSSSTPSMAGNVWPQQP